MAEVQSLYYVVHDMLRAQAFYEGLLGMRLKFANGVLWAQYDGSRGQLALAAPEEAPARARGAVAVLEVDDLDACQARLRAAGTPIHGLRDMGSHGRVLTLFDPDGNLLQLFARNPMPATPT